MDVEHIFNRAFKFSFAKKKLIFVFPILALCGLLVVLFRTLSVGANNWVGVSLAFLPVFLCTGILLAAAVVLIRIYHDEVKGRHVGYRKTIRHSWDLMLGVSYFSLPLVLAYLVLWIVLGVFYLFKGIPKIGNTLGVVLSFGPFLLILGSLVLSLFSLLLLFFVTPVVALKSTARFSLVEEMLHRFKTNFFSHFSLLVLGLIPLLIVVGLLILAAALTGMTYFTTERTWAIAMQWFIIMLPFAALLSPALIFFFNFAAESFVWMQRKK